MRKTISNNQLTPGEIYFVRGNVTFSRVSRQTTDQEREKDNQRRQHPVDKNYTTLSICNAKVIAKDPTAPTLEERYAAECLYKSSNADYTGNCFTAINKSKNLPSIRVKNENGVYDEIKIKHELAQGLDVTACMRVFKGKGNNGVSLDTVIVNEPIRYFEGQSSAVADAAMSVLGITFSASAPREDDEETEVETANEYDGEIDNTPVETATPFQNVPSAFAATAPAPQTNAPDSSMFAPADSGNIGAGPRRY